MATCLQQPFFRPNVQKNSYIDSCLKPLYNGHLFTMATFFCPPGGHCREVQLYITMGLVKHSLKYGATCHQWIFCFLSHVTRSSTRFSITCSRFLICAGMENRVENQDPQQTVNLHLNGTVWYMYKDLVDF